MERNEQNGFTVRAKLPGLNEYTAANRTHFRKGAEMKAETEEYIILGIQRAKREGRCRHVDGPCIVVFFWHEANRKRDPDNIFSAKKFVLDAMQHCGVIDGDGQKYIRGLYDCLVPDTEWFVEVRIMREDETKLVTLGGIRDIE